MISAFQTGDKVTAIAGVVKDEEDFGAGSGAGGDKKINPEEDK